MKLDPVFLVAPKPKPPSMTRRRALGFIAGASCAAGIAGFWLGWVSNRTQRVSAAPRRAPQSAALLDPRVQWIRNLLDSHADDEIFSQHAALITSCLGRTNQPTVVEAVTRLAVITAARPTDPRAPMVARSLLQLQGIPELQPALAPYLGQLESILR